jgi:hypothetical protein
MINLKYNFKSVILVSIGFLIVGLIGVFAGHWFVNWRQVQANERRAESYMVKSEGLLSENDLFPYVSLINSARLSVNTHDVIAGRKTVVLFISPGCKPCTDAIKLWAPYLDKLPPDFNVIGIVNASYEYASDYLSEAGFPYPFYCDTGFVFLTEYGINGYPRCIGIDDNGRIAFLFRGPFSAFTPLDAYKRLKNNNNS